MSTITRFIRGSRIADNAQAARVISNVIDFSLLACAGSDVVKCLKLDPGTILLAVGARVLTVEGEACSATLGDVGTADEFISGTTLNLNALTDIAGTVAAPVYYSAEEFITMTLTNSNPINVAKVLVWAVVANVDGNVV